MPGEDVLRNAIMSGHVHVEQTGPQTLVGDAGRMVFDFGGQNELKKVHAVDAVRLRETKSSSLQGNGVSSSPQDFELTAPAIDFVVARGNTLTRAESAGLAQITIAQAQDPIATNAAPSPQQTVVTAAKFQAYFSDRGGHNHLASVHGSPDARIVNSTPGKPDRVSTSDAVDAIFLPQGGIDSITQTGNVAYTDGQDPDKRLQASANSARYTPSDQILRAHRQSADLERGHGNYFESYPNQPRNRRSSRRRRRQEHVQRNEGAAERSAAGIFLSHPRDVADHDRAHFRGRCLLRQSAALAGRERH